jgi:signal transduction histidine kinase
MIQTWLRTFTVDIEKIRENFKPVSIPEVIAKAVEIVQPHAQRKAIELLTAGPSDLGPVAGDEVTLVEAVVNLLGNAVKYSHTDSQITVTATQERDRIEIAVTDTGVGIPADELPHVFGDFYRGQRGTEAGAGLGLAITRRIVEAHDGTIAVESTPGEGSTFTITLPVPPAGAAQAVPAGRAPGSSRQGGAA